MSKPMSVNTHDLKVIAFHVFVAALQAALIQIKVENFGSFTPYVVMFVGVVAESLRRYING